MPIATEDVVRLIQQAGSRPVDLSGQDLRGLRLNGKNQKIDLIEANLRGANLQGAHLLNLNMYRANLNYTNLTDAKLEQCTLVESEGIESIFFHASLHAVRFNAGNYRCADFTGLTGHDITFDAANLGATSFKDAVVVYASAHHASMTHATLEHAFFFSLDAEGAWMQNVRFLNARVIESCFRATDLRDADFEDAKFYRSYVTGATIFSSPEDYDAWCTACKIPDLRAL